MDILTYTFYRYSAHSLVRTSIKNSTSGVSGSHWILIHLHKESVFKRKESEENICLLNAVSGIGFGSVWKSIQINNLGNSSNVDLTLRNFLDPDPES
jgi:hypothetical protein